MRNVVAILGLLIAAGTTSALPTELPACDYQKCLNIVELHGASCLTVNDALECAATEILNNPACPADVVAAAQKPIEQATNYLETQCRGRVRQSEPEVCLYESCREIVRERVMNCRNVGVAILCGEGRLLNNSACPADVRSEARDLVRQWQEFLEEHCPFDIMGLTDCRPICDLWGSNKCDVRRCFEGVNSCQALFDGVQCADRTILNNPDCDQNVVRMVEREKEDAINLLKSYCNRDADEFDSPALPREKDSGCHYEECLAIIGRHEPDCSNVPAAILCGEGRVLNNSACPEHVRSQTRDLIRQGQEFLKEQCPFHISGGSEKCDVRKCLEGVNTQGVTCQTVADGIQCVDKTILNNPDCDRNLIRDVESAKEDTIFLLKQYCNSHPHAFLDNYQLSLPAQSETVESVHQTQ